MIFFFWNKAVKGMVALLRGITLSWIVKILKQLVLKLKPNNRSLPNVLINTWNSTFNLSKFDSGHCELWLLFVWFGLFWYITFSVWNITTFWASRESNPGPMSETQRWNILYHITESFGSRVTDLLSKIFRGHFEG